jgi:hypothetical protein
LVLHFYQFPKLKHSLLFLAIDLEQTRTTVFHALEKAPVLPDLVLEFIVLVDLLASELYLILFPLAVEVCHDLLAVLVDLLEQAVALPLEHQRRVVDPEVPKVCVLVVLVLETPESCGLGLVEPRHVVLREKQVLLLLGASARRVVLPCYEQLEPRCRLEELLRDLCCLFRVFNVFGDELREDVGLQKGGSDINFLVQWRGVDLVKGSPFDFGFMAVGFEEEGTHGLVVLFLLFDCER